ncbi:hypothetical protein MKW94_014845, partial [Papaver nudicaule]|nr:hypothetical protein [Papaver nudicaule]
MSATELGSDRDNRPQEETIEIKDLLKVLIQSQAKLAEAQAQQAKSQENMQNQMLEQAKSQENMQNQMLEQAKSQENIQNQMLEVLKSNNAGNKQQ